MFLDERRVSERVNIVAGCRVPLMRAGPNLCSAIVLAYVARRADVDVHRRRAMGPRLARRGCLLC